MSEQDMPHVYQAVHEEQECDVGFRLLNTYHSEIYAGTADGLEAATSKMHELVEKCKDENFGMDKCHPRCRSRIASFVSPSRDERASGMVLHVELRKNRYEEEKEYDPDAPIIHYGFWVYKKTIMPSCERVESLRQNK